MNKGTVCNYPVKDLTIVRKWNNMSAAPQEPQYKDPSFTIEIKKPDIQDIIAIVSDCIGGIKKRQQECAKSALNINGIPPCIRINVVSGEVTFTKFWIEQVVAFTEKDTGETYTFNTEDKTITRFQLMNPYSESMSIEEFITLYVSPATTNYLKEERIRAIHKDVYGLWYFTGNSNKP